MNCILVNHWSYWWSRKMFDNEKRRPHDHFQGGEGGFG